MWLVCCWPVDEYLKQLKNQRSLSGVKWWPETPTFIHFTWSRWYADVINRQISFLIKACPTFKDHLTSEILQSFWVAPPGVTLFVTLFPDFSCIVFVNKWHKIQSLDIGAIHVIIELNTDGVTRLKNIRRHESCYFVNWWGIVRIQIQVPIC